MKVEFLKTREALKVPFGILSLSSYIKMKNKERLDKVALLDFKAKFESTRTQSSLNDFIDDCVRAVDFYPDIVGISALMTTSHHFINKLSYVIKSIFPQCVTIVGGYHATNYTRQILETNNSIDYAIRGEGEIALSLFIERVSNRADPTDIRGVFDLAKSRKAESKSELGDFVELDTMPALDYGLLDLEQYFKKCMETAAIKDATKSSQRAMQIMTSRGCPGRCIFCCAHTVHGRKTRYYSTKHIIDEVSYFNNKYNINIFFIEDDLFTANKKRVLEILSELKKLGIKGMEIQLSQSVSVSTLDAEIIDALVSAGMRSCFVPVESGSPYVQKYIIKKNIELEKAKWCVQYLRSKGVSVRAGFMLGFPRETKEQMAETVSFAETLDADFLDIYVAIPLLGTEMAQEFIKLGYIKNEEELVEKHSTSLRQFDTEEITANELNELAYKVNLKCNFINNVKLREKRWKEAASFFESMVALNPFHIIGWHCLATSYEGLNQSNKIAAIEEKINSLVATDERSHSLATKFGYLIGMGDGNHPYAYPKRR